MRITSKGQVTIPVEIRRQAGLLPDTEVEFVVEGGNVVVRKAARESAGRGHRLVESLRGRARAGWTTEEIMALTRGEDE
ncbi:MAG: AbrB/MazE/SpoVT family DNA-binding domain-containing protein [Halofilum sp. (in: g-proteobacteria)]|nr:AbrB/MazE/SpoVT family DNA-binding domain-containing protein [Halofilum sp. (in: g-proteobacteria)]